MTSTVEKKVSWVMGFRYTTAMGLVWVAASAAAQSHVYLSEQQAAPAAAAERAVQPPVVDEAQQRRLALRAALQAQRNNEAPAEGLVKGRQLTPEERAELRHQLRQQRREGSN